MKIKLLIVVLGAGFVLASCTDKEAEARMKQMEIDMHIADSTCQAGMMMMQHNMDSVTHILDSMMMAKMMGTTTKTTTTTTSTPDKKVDPPVKKKEGTNSGVDVKKKTGSNQGGGK